jgi:2-polyprenyl-6-methoxyphenol hydroxylase-like FAD-dependent oxidoreductase
MEAKAQPTLLLALRWLAMPCVVCDGGQSEVRKALGRQQSEVTFA